MATYHQKKDLWEARRRIHGRRVSVYAPTESEAEQKADLLSLPMSRGETLGSYALNVYTLTVKDHSLKWREQIAWALDSHILPKLGHLLLTDLNRAVIQGFLERVKLGRTSKGHLRKILHAILDLAETDGLITANPVRKVKLPPIRTSEKPMPFTAGEVRLIWQAATCPKVKNAIFLGFLGLRKGEVLGLRWSDCLEDELRVEVQYEGEPLKSGSSQRRIPMPKGWKAHLVPIRGSRVCGRISPRNLLGRYTSKEKGIYGQGFKGAIEKANLPDRTFHSLRSTCATELLDADCPDRLRDEILGHGVRNVRDRYGKGKMETKRGYMSTILRAYEVGVNLEENA